MKVNNKRPRVAHDNNTNINFFQNYLYYINVTRRQACLAQYKNCFQGFPF